VIDVTPGTHVASSRNPTFAPAANAMPTPSTPTACYDSGPYDGTGDCHAGGEFVTVRHVLAGARGPISAPTWPRPAG
jgi:hypothetical protein